MYGVVIYAGSDTKLVQNSGELGVVEGIRHYSRQWNSKAQLIYMHLIFIFACHAFAMIQSYMYAASGLHWLHSLRPTALHVPLLAFHVCSHLYCSASIPQHNMHEHMKIGIYLPLLFRQDKIQKNTSWTTDEQTGFICKLLLCIFQQFCNFYYIHVIQILCFLIGCLLVCFIGSLIFESVYDVVSYANYQCTLSIINLCITSSSISVSPFMFLFTTSSIFIHYHLIPTSSLLVCKYILSVCKFHPGKRTH